MRLIHGAGLATRLRLATLLVVDGLCHLSADCIKITNQFKFFNKLTICVNENKTQKFTLD